MSVNSKTIFKCLSILGTAGVLLFGCMKAEMELPYVDPVEKEAIKVLFELGHAEAINDSARFDTKSYLTAADIETRISNVTLGIYETTGTQAYLGYITSGFGSVGVTLRSDKTYNIYALANMGDMRTSLAAAVSAGTLSSMTYTVDYSTMSTVGIPMSKAITGQSFSEGQNVTVYLERMLAKINVSLSCSWSEAVITGATVKNVNPTVSPFGTAPASSTNIPSLQDIHGAVAGTSSSLSAVFYVPENTQGTVGSVTASTEKTYSNSSLSGIRDYATYLEVNVTTTGEYNGSIVYRSYLGANQTTDFNILRNEVYNWTITYSKNNLQTYDWKRDTDNLYRYELVCIDQNTNISIYAHHSSQSNRTGLLRYRLNKYSVRTGSLVEAISVTPSVVSYYESADGSRTSNLLETYSISSGSVTVLANSGYAGPVYVQAQATYNGQTYRTAARKKVHVNGFVGWEYLQWTYNFAPKHQQLLSGKYVTFYQDNFSYRVKSYYDGTIQYQSNASCIQNGLNSTIGLPSGFGGVSSVGYREEYYYDAPTGYEYYEGLYFSLIVPNNSTLPYYASGEYGPISVNTTSTLGADFYPSGGFTASCNVYLYSNNIVSAYINPNKADVNAGGSQQFRFYYNSTDISSSATTTWSIVSSTGGMTGLNISSSGLFTAASNASSGTVIIQASSSTYNVSRTAIIKVTAIDSPEITYSPSRLVVTGDASVAVGSTTSNYTATLYYDEYHGGVLYASDLTADVSTQSTFSSSDTGIATMSGRAATGVAAGTAYISASYTGTYGTYSTDTADRATLTVTGGGGPVITYRMYDITFAANPINVGGSTTATARKQKFVDGVASGEFSSASATWTSNNSSVASIVAATGAISGVNAGSTTFVATDTSCESGFQSVTSSTFTVNAVVTPSIRFSPWNFSVAYDECVGYSNSLDVTASYENTGDESGFTSDYSGTSNCSAADFSYGNSGATVWFYWTSNNMTGSSRSVDISLTDPVTGASDYIRITQAYDDTPYVPTVTWRIEPTSLTFTPNPVNVGSTASCNETIIKRKYEDGKPTGVTAAASLSWDSDDTSVATVSSGTVSGVAAGNATITATDSSCEAGYQTASGSITVNPPYTPTVTWRLEPTSLSFSPNPIDVGGTASCTTTLVKRKYEDGVATSVTDTPSLTWSSSNTSIATVSGGTVTGQGAGTATITATDTSCESSHRSASGSITVNPPYTPTVTWRLEPTSLSFSPNPIDVGGTASCTTTLVKRKYEDNVATTVTDTPSLSWSSNNTSIATVSGGTVTGQGAGTATITATDSSCESGYQTASGGITVNYATTYKVEVSPSSADIYVGGTQSFTSTLYRSTDGGSSWTAITPSGRSWSSSSTSVATINSSGVASGSSNGSTTITGYCTYGGNTYSDTATLNVHDNYSLSISGTTSAHYKSSINLTVRLLKNGVEVSTSGISGSAQSGSFSVSKNSNTSFTLTTSHCCKYYDMSSYTVRFSCYTDSYTGTITEDESIEFLPYEYHSTIGLTYYKKPGNVIEYWAEARGDGLPPSTSVTATDSAGNTWTISAPNTASSSIDNPSGGNYYAPTALSITSLSTYNMFVVTPGGIYEIDWTGSIGSTQQQ